MESLYLLIPLSIVVLGAAIGCFLWAVGSGQYDDVEREGERILYDDDDLENSPQMDICADGDRGTENE
jgi:cbb3-type cytochrome oxidase maturation protein